MNIVMGLRKTTLGLVRWPSGFGNALGSKEGSYNIKPFKRQKSRPKFTSAEFQEMFHPSNNIFSIQILEVKPC